MSGLTMSIGGWIMKQLASAGVKHVIGQISEDEIEKRFRKCINAAAEKVQITYPDAIGGYVEGFFKDEVIFRMLFSTLFVNSEVNIEEIERHLDTSTLPVGFINNYLEGLKVEVLSDRYLERIFTENKLLISMLNVGEGIESILKYTKLTFNEINAIRQSMETEGEEDLRFVKKLDKYKKNLAHNFSEVNYIGLGLSKSYNNNRNYKLKDIYVKPYFASRGVDQSLYSERLGIEDIFNGKKNLVILGKPGSGKSVLVKFLMVSIVEGKNEKAVNANLVDYIPFRIELRKYLSYKKINHCDIVRYLKNLLTEEYSINFNEDEITEILSSDRIIMFFDGLDEIFDVTDKISVRNDIENFGRNFEKARIVVTSRFIGYEEARMNQEEFNEYHILKFSNEQIEEYVNKWYKVEEYRVEVRKNEVANFIKQKGTVDNELIENPLLLSLIVIIYRNNLELPRTKLEIYKSCTKTLVDKWDAAKKLPIAQKITDKRDTIFAHIAFWHYEHASKKVKRKELTNHQVKLRIMDYLLENITKNYEQAEVWAEEFLDYAEKRSLYFDNNFTHKTFLEYYTAYYIFVNYEKKNKPKETMKLIRKYFGNSFWFIVLELLLNLIDEDQPDNDIMDKIINDLINWKEETYVFCLKVLPTLKNISEDLVVEVVASSIRKCIMSNNFGVGDSRGNDFSKGLFEAIRYIHQFSNTKSLFLEQFMEIYKEARNDSSLVIKYLHFINEFDSAELLSDELIIEDLEKYYMHDPKLYMHRAHRFAFTNHTEELIDFVTIFGKWDPREDIDHYFDGSSFMFNPYVIFNLIQFSENKVRHSLVNVQRVIEAGIDVSALVETITLRPYLVRKLSLDSFKRLVIQSDKAKDIDVAAFLLFIAHAKSTGISDTSFVDSCVDNLKRKNINKGQIKNLLSKDFVRDIKHFETLRAALLPLADTVAL